MSLVVFVEGPDGAGKTTLARRLAVDLSFDYAHEGPPPKGRWAEDWREAYDHYVGKARRAAAAAHGTVFDRFAWSEPFYGPKLRGVSGLTEYEMDDVDRLKAALGARLVLCLPPVNVCLEAWAERRESELLKSEADMRECHSYYSGLVGGCDWWYVDRGEVDYQALLSYLKGCAA